MMMHPLGHSNPSHLWSCTWEGEETFFVQWLLAQMEVQVSSLAMTEASLSVQLHLEGALVPPDPGNQGSSRMLWAFLDPLEVFTQQPLTSPKRLWSFILFPLSEDQLGTKRIQVEELGRGGVGTGQQEFLQITLKPSCRSDTPLVTPECPQWMLQMLLDRRDVQPKEAQSHLQGVLSSGSQYPGLEA